MIGRLIAWWRSRGRRIYSYWDGRRRRWADPIEIHSRLEEAAGGSWEKLLTTIGAAPPPGAGQASRAQRAKEQQDAITKLVAAARKAFGASPLDDKAQGLTEAETVALVADYFQWLGGVADEAGPFVTSNPPASQSESENLATAPSSASGGSESELQPRSPDESHAP